MLPHSSSEKAVQGMRNALWESFTYWQSVIKSLFFFFFLYHLHQLTGFLSCIMFFVISLLFPVPLLTASACEGGAKAEAVL